MNEMVKNWVATGKQFSPKLWAVLICDACCLLFVLFQGGKLSLMLFAIITLLSLYLISGRWSGIANTRGRRTIPSIEQGSVLEAGSTLKVYVQFHIPGAWPIPYVTVNDVLKRKNGEPITIEASSVLNWKRNGEFTYQTPPLRRGLYHFAASTCSTEDIFGLFQHSGVMNMPFSFSVLPKTIAIPEWEQYHQMLRGQHHHTSATQAHRETTQINGVREYIYGDRISRIHWNATARTGTWKSKEFEREALPKTVVVLDREAQAYKSAEQFELAVSIAASLFEFGVREDLSLGLLSVGAKSVYMEPSRSTAHRHKVMDHLIDVDADGRFSLINVLKDRARLEKGTLFVIISPGYGEHMLRTVHWLKGRQLNVCHFWISQDQSASVAESWIHKLRTQDCLAYRIGELQELPSLLGRRVAG